ncbi:TetR/AcrR family transcriptional regulator [Azospirillum sp. 412522]|nr:TetR/AcrR family transcriptional regulator [Azospirillum sp. 412522]
MGTGRPDHLTPRKMPRQARAVVTLDAIFEATIQVLVAEGMQRLTTTRVAHRAGVSVGTMYQYFPHKQALIYALNERYLDVLAARIEATCRSQQGAPLDRMVEALIDTYWRAKTERPEITRALYRSVAEIDNEAMIAAFCARVDAATTGMLRSACDATFTDLETVNLTLVTVIFGTVRNAFERNLGQKEADGLYRQLILLCRSYLDAVVRTGGQCQPDSKAPAENF